jgi:hypothetical protein
MDYLLEFNNGIKFTFEAKNLDAVHKKCVDVIEANRISSCIITTPYNTLRRVRKTGATHWKHNGYEFD